MATVPTLRPSDETMCDDDRSLSPEHIRRIVRNTLYTYNERCLQIGGGFSLVDSDGVARRTLWRATANWSNIGPFGLYVPDALGAPNIVNGGRPTVRVLVNFRTQGEGNVALWALNFGVAAVAESAMDAVWDAGVAAAGPYAIVESDPGIAESFTVALELPVHPGDNVFFLALKCAPDTDVTPTTLANTYRMWMSGNSTSEVRHPAVVTDEDKTNVAAPFAYIDVAEDSTALAADQFTRYTVPRRKAGFSSLTDNSGYLCYEATNGEWEGARNAETVDPGLALGPGIVARYGSLVRCYIDGISIDGTQQFSLEDRGFGAPHRYFQLVSGTHVGASIREAYAAHEARFPQASVCNDVNYDLALSDSNIVGVPALWTTVAGGSSYATGGSIGFGLYDTTASFGEPQETLPGTTEEVVIAFAFLLADLVASTSRSVPPLIEARAFLTNPAGANTFGTSQVFRGSLLPSDVRLFRHLCWSSVQGSSVGVLYQCEGMTLRSDIGFWAYGQVAITPASSWRTDARRLVGLQVRTTNSTSGGGVASPARIIAVAPINVRLRQVAG
jgi:hypothetical protein